MTSAVDVSDLASRHDVLAAEWKKGDLDAVRSSLNSLKQLLTKREFLPTGEGLVGVQQVREVPQFHAILGYVGSSAPSGPADCSRCPRDRGSPCDRHQGRGRF